MCVCVRVCYHGRKQEIAKREVTKRAKERMHCGHICLFKERGIQRVSDVYLPGKKKLCVKPRDGYVKEKARSGGSTTLSSHQRFRSQVTNEEIQQIQIIILINSLIS